MNRTEKEILFEEKLDALILLKELLIKNGEFHGQEEEEYYQALDRAFELLNQTDLKNNGLSGFNSPLS